MQQPAAGKNLVWNNLISVKIEGEKNPNKPAK